MRNILFICGLTICATLITSCSKDDDNTKGESKRLINLIPEKNPITLTDTEKAYVKSCNEFAFNFFRQTNETEESYIMSPISMAFALGMLQHGAEGETEKEIKNNIGFKDADKNAISKFFANLIENVPKVDSNVQINIANALFVNKDINMLTQYEKDMKDYYQATTKTLDFSNQSAVNEINKWCERQTDGNISEILEETNPGMNAYLLNAISFKAAWTNHFEEKYTWKASFTKEDGTSVSIPMMHRTANANIFANDFCTTLCLPFSNGSFAIFVILPNNGVGTQEIMEKMNTTAFDEIKSQMTQQQIELSIPRFSTTFEKDLTNSLIKMGMAKALSNEAEFPYITTDKMNIGKIKQKAIIEVDEHGTKTAAVTITEADGAVVYMPDVFHANRPFVYIIQELTSGAIFFIGTYMGD